MPTIDELTSEQIRSPEIFQKIKELGDSFVRCNQAKEAYFLQEKLKNLLSASNLQNLNPDLYKNYQNLLVALKWVALPLLPEEEVLNVLNHRFLAVLENQDIDAQERIEAKMFTLDLFPRNELRQKMQRALKENKERLGNKTFSEWLLDYSKTFDFRDRDELTPAQYIRQNPEAQTLSESEKNKLKKALRLFDRALLVTPVMDEFSLGLLLGQMINSGTIKIEDVNPTLLQSLPVPIEKPEITRILTETAAKRATEEKRETEGIEKKKPELVLPTETRETPEEIHYEGKVSPYEQEREIRPAQPIKEEISTFPKEKEIEIPPTKPKPKPTPKLKPAPEPPKPEPLKDYQIRTMKQDIARLDARQEKAKKQPMPTGRQAIPPKPTPKVKDNIVDLSGK